MTVPSEAELPQGPPVLAVPAMCKLLLSPVPCQGPTIWVQTPNVRPGHTSDHHCRAAHTSNLPCQSLQKECLVQKEH